MAPSAPPSVVVARRFRGPARSGNGGYTAGRLASSLAGLAGLGADIPVTVTLRRPPPLEVEMAVVGTCGGEAEPGMELRYDDQLVASAVAGSFQVAPPAPVDFETATAARSAYLGGDEHPFPGCFVCGPARQPGDGMRLAPGLVGPGLTACIWVPDPSLASVEDPAVALSEVGWAALDCPGGWTSDIGNRPLVLGRMTAYCGQARIGRPHVAVGELLGVDGRKTFTATAVYDEGRLVGRGEQTWIAVDPTSFQDGT